MGARPAAGMVLFPELLDTSVNPASFSTLRPMSMPWSPRATQSRDRFFTHVASIAEENAFFNSGASAGFGVRLTYDTSANRVFVVEAFEGAPALAQGIDRGTEIIAVGTSTSNLQSVSSLMQSGGAQAVVSLEFRIEVGADAEDDGAGRPGGSIDNKVNKQARVERAGLVLLVPNRAYSGTCI